MAQESKRDRKEEEEIKRTSENILKGAKEKNQRRQKSGKFLKAIKENKYEEQRAENESNEDNRLMTTTNLCCKGGKIVQLLFHRGRCCFRL